MKILMVLDYYRPNVSGLSITVERLAHGLSERGHSVTVLTHRHRADLPSEETNGSVRILRAPVFARFGKALVSPALVAIARREMAQTDVLHLHAPLVPAVPLAILAGHLRVPLVTNYHCDLKLPPGVVNRVVERIARASQDFALERSAVIINSTDDYARHTPALARRLERFVGIVPPVPDLPVSRTTARDLLTRWGVPGGPVILFVGRFADEKGLPDLIAALPAVHRDFPEAVLLLAGENRNVPGETVGARLETLLANPGSRVIATGLVADEEMGALFEAADLLVLPSTNSTESFGMIQVEAMLRGVPVVASDLPGVREPVRRTGMGEIAAVKNPDALARKIVSVLGSPDRYRRPPEIIREAFSLEATFFAYESAYERARRSTP